MLLCVALSIQRGKVAVPKTINRLSSISIELRLGDHVIITATLLLIFGNSEFLSALTNHISWVNVTFVDAESGASQLTIQVVSGTGAYQGQTDLDPVLNQLVYVVPSDFHRSL